MLYRARLTHCLDEDAMELAEAEVCGLAILDAPDLPGRPESRIAWLIYELQLPFAPYAGLGLLTDKFSLVLGCVNYDLSERVFQCEVVSLVPNEDFDCVKDTGQSTFEHELALYEALGWRAVELGGDGA